MRRGNGHARKGDGPTSQFVHEVEGPKQKKRREINKVLKQEFRTIAERAAEKVFGKDSDQLAVMRDSDIDNTEKVIGGVIKICHPRSFNKMLEEFFSEVELIRGTAEERVKLEEPMTLWGYIAASEDKVFRERATIATIEVLMATGDESITKFFLQRTTQVEEHIKMQILEGIIDFADINYIHTIAAMSEAFVRNPMGAADFVTKMAERIKTRPSFPGRETETLYSDFFLSGIVKSNFGF